MWTIKKQNDREADWEVDLDLLLCYELQHTSYTYM